MINNFLLYKLTTGIIVMNKTFSTMFQTSHWLKFARGLCKAESRCLSSMVFRRWSITILQCKQNFSPSFTWNVPVGYVLARSWAVRLGGRSELAFMVEETVRVFTKFSVIFNRFFNKRNYILPKSWQLRLFLAPILLTIISHSVWLM